MPLGRGVLGRIECVCRSFTIPLQEAHRLRILSEQLPSTHVKDIASAVFTVLKAALEGRAEEGKEGICKSTTRRRSVEES